MEDYQLGRGKGRVREKVQVFRSIIGWAQNRQGDFKNSVGNGEAKEHPCTTHGHELKQGDHWREGGGLGGEGQRGENWDN